MDCVSEYQPTVPHTPSSSSPFIQEKGDVFILLCLSLPGRRPLSLDALTSMRWYPKTLPYNVNLSSKQQCGQGGLRQPGGPARSLGPYDGQTGLSVPLPVPCALHPADVHAARLRQPGRLQPAWPKLAIQSKKKNSDMFRDHG